MMAQDGEPVTQRSGVGENRCGALLIDNPSNSKALTTCGPALGLHSGNFFFVPCLNTSKHRPAVDLDGLRHARRNELASIHTFKGVQTDVLGHPSVPAVCGKKSPCGASA